MYHNEHATQNHISSFMAGVYGWMSCALMVTAASAYYVAITPALMNLFFTSSTPLIILCVAQLALVFGIIFFLPRMNFITALVMFLLYATSLGITMASIFFVFELGSIISTFLTTALTFGAMSLYGYVTKTDLTTMGNMSVMVLIGLMIAMIINMFLKSERLEYIISAIGVIIFVLLTAYDTQKIKQLAYGTAQSPYNQSNHPLDEHNHHGQTNDQAIKKLTIVGALVLYLDFVNLFLFLLRFMGKRRDQ